MDTLRKIRKEPIVELTGEVTSPDTSYLAVELLKRKGNILIVINHTDEIVNTVLSKIDPEDSGYIFFASELLLDPLNNYMVPEHRIATSEEIDNLLHNKIPLEKLPIIRMLDPIRRWHNFPRGSVIAILRKAGTRVERTHESTPDTDFYFRRVV
jgi:DNA-directed RNA polymerase subunit H (RpoH/RPB5)